MKYIILLLAISASCLAQTKVTAYRLINESVDGPCSIKTYLEHPDEMSFMSVVVIESLNKTFYEDLLNVKKYALQWETKGFNCGDKVIGGDMIHNMFVLEKGSLKDTLYTTKNNDYVVYPEKSVAYFDKKGTIKSIFISEIREFFDHDFETYIRMTYLMTMDTISPEKIVYKGKVLDSLKEDINILVINDDLIVDGLKVGDHENTLKSRFLLSTVHKSIWSSRYEDHKDQYRYYYVVEIEGSKSDHVIFNIENKKIVSIGINIYAPD